MDVPKLFLLSIREFLTETMRDLSECVTLNAMGQVEVGWASSYCMKYPEDCIEP